MGVRREGFMSTLAMLVLRATPLATLGLAATMQSFFGLWIIPSIRIDGGNEPVSPQLELLARPSPPNILGSLIHTALRSRDLCPQLDQNANTRPCVERPHLFGRNNVHQREAFHLTARANSKARSFQPQQLATIPPPPPHHFARLAKL